jgi:hypothetical protein
VIVLILILGVVGFFVWKMAGKKADEKNNNTQQQVVEPKIVKVVDESVIAPIPSFQNNSIWYFNSDARLLRVNLNGSGTTEFPLPALNNAYIKDVLWSPSGSDFIVTLVNGAGDQKTYYNSETKRYVALPAQIKNIAWLADGKRIAYIWQSNDNIHQQLAVSNPDNTGYRIVKDVFWPDLKIYPLNDGKTALLIRSKADEDINKIYSIDLENGDFKTLIDQGKNISIQTIPNKNAIVYSKMKENGTFQMYYYDFDKKTEVDTKISTSTDKIVADPEGKYLIASAPKLDYSGDEFIKLDLDSLKSESYFIPGESVRARNLVLVGQMLYFVNSKDSKLYRIEK